MKSFTSLEQSKKLAEFLPLESADMRYLPSISEVPFIWSVKQMQESEAIPAWSLSALLDVLKYPSLTQDVENKWSITDWTGAYPKSEHGFDSPVDACYEMIIKLHELNLL